MKNTDKIIEEFMKIRSDNEELRILRQRPAMLGDLINFASSKRGRSMKTNKEIFKILLGKLKNCGNLTTQEKFDENTGKSKLVEGFHLIEMIEDYMVKVLEEIDTFSEKDIKGSKERMNFDCEFLLLDSKVKGAIKECEGKHVQQIAYSSYHDSLTQICFGCKKIRTSLKKEDALSKESGE